MNPAKAAGCGCDTSPARCGYNRLVKRFAFAAVAGITLLSGCNRAVESQETVRQAVLDHLAKRAGLNVSSMQIDVVTVSFRQNEADATVSFRAKGSGGGPMMTMHYTLEKQGNRWVVKGRSNTGAAGQMPGGLPSGHPQVGGRQPSETSK